MDKDLINDYNFLMVCNDYIVSILQEADKKGWANTKLELKEKDKKKFKSKKYDIFYFRNHGYSSVINQSLYRHIIFSLIADYNIFIEDVIECCKREHFSTAYTLLRKPFKDDLLMIEWFYSSGHRIVSKFVNNPIADFDVSKVSKDKIKRIIRKVCNKIDFFTAKKMYDLRYSKDSYESLEKLWNKAIHIITSKKEYKTEDANLNMIFYSDSVVQENITYIYKVLCSVQLYFVVLISNILLDEGLITLSEYNYNINNIFILFFTILSDANLSDEQLKHLTYQCQNCGNNNFFDRKRIILNSKTRQFEIICDKCKKRAPIKKFIFTNNN